MQFLCVLIYKGSNLYLDYEQNLFYVYLVI